MIGELGTIWMPIPEANVFQGYWGKTQHWIVIHKTASAGTAQDVAHFFANDPARASSHYIIGQDGAIVQCVSESDGAGANCCAEAGYASFLPGHLNLNLVTISVEHCDPASDNSTPLTDAQKAASFKLIKDICERHSIPMRRGDANGGIIGHSDIAPISRAHCPGNYPWEELFAYLENGGNMIPEGWHDDGTTLTAPNGIPVVHGFRAFVLAHNWEKDNWPLLAEYGTPELEYSDPALGGGTQQVFRWSMLGWTQSRGVFLEWIGIELLRWKSQFEKLYQLYQADEEKLKQQPSGDLVQRLSLISGLVQQAGPILQQIGTAATVK